MEIRHRILVFDNNPQYAILKNELDLLKVKYEYKPNRFLGHIICWLKDTDPNFEKLKPLIYHQHVTVATGVFFTPKDFDQAEWFYILTSESQYPEGEEDYRFETYELADWCDKCGVGAIQTRPFRLSRDFQHKRNLFYGLHWVFDEIFARPSVQGVLDENGITGITYLHPIYHKSGKVIVNSVQLKVDFITKPGLIWNGFDDHAFSIDRNLWTTQAKYAHYCPFCKRVKYRFPERDIIKFKREVFDAAPDIVKSYEYFGGGGQALHLMLVSKRFYQVIRKNKLPGLIFKPISLV